MRLCECGCGTSLPNVTYGSRRPDGLFKTRPSSARFLRGHHLRVVRPSWWKGDGVGYRALHTYLCKHYPKTGRCEECGEIKPTEYALIQGRTYSRVRTDYRELCKRCHNQYDGIDLGKLATERAAARRVG